MAAFLGALGLQIVDFADAAAALGGAPYIGDVVLWGMKHSQATVVLFTPDEYSVLDPSPPILASDDSQRWQSRPNVIFEAGMAFGLSQKNTVLVTLGSEVSLFSDVGGVHILKMDDSLDMRRALRARLKGMGCSIIEGSAFEKAGKFSPRPVSLQPICDLLAAAGCDGRPIPALGIRNLFAIPRENADRDRRMLEILSGPGPFRLLARSGFSYLHPDGCNYQAGLGAHLFDRGTRIKVLLENPHSPSAQTRLRAEGRDGGDPWAKMSRAEYQKLLDDLEKAGRSNLDLRFTNEPVHCSLLFAPDTVIYDPYHFGKIPPSRRSIGNQFLVLEFALPADDKRGEEGDYYCLLEEHLNFLWGGPTLTFEEICRNYPERTSTASDKG